MSIEEREYTQREWKDQLHPLLKARSFQASDPCQKGLQCSKCNPYVSGVKTIFHRFYKSPHMEYEAHAYRKAAVGPVFIKLRDKNPYLRMGHWKAKEWNEVILPAIEKGFITQVRTLPKGLFSLYCGVLQEQDVLYEVDAGVDTNSHEPFVQVYPHIDEKGK